MATAKLHGKGKGQKLIIEADEPGEYTLTRTEDENEPLKMEFKPNGKKEDAKGVSEQTKNTPSRERNTFFDEE